jgi:aspartyl/asparaginyl beta-hydroxylase (cupin superfamily)
MVAVAPKLATAAGFAGAAGYVHFRGRARHSLVRQLGDHSTFVAPSSTARWRCSRTGSCSADSAWSIMDF